MANNNIKLNLQFWSSWWRRRGYWCYLALLCLVIFTLGLAILGLNVLYQQHCPWWLWMLLYLGWFNLSACFFHGVSRNAWALSRGWGRDRYPIFSLEYWGRGVQQLAYLLFVISCWLGVAGGLIWGLMQSNYSYLLAAFLLWCVVLTLQWHWHWSLVYLANHQCKITAAWRQSLRLKAVYPRLTLLNTFAKYLVAMITFFIPIIGIIIGLSIILSMDFVFALEPLSEGKH